MKLPKNEMKLRKNQIICPKYYCEDLYMSRHSTTDARPCVPTTVTRPITPIIPIVLIALISSDL